MSFFLDALLILICISIIIFSAKRGFVKTLFSFFSTVVSLVCSYTFAPSLASYLKSKFFLEPISSSIAETVRSVAPAYDGGYDLGLLLSDMSPTMSSILERYKTDVESLRELVPTISVCEDPIRTMADIIATPVVDVISVCVAFISVFLIFSLALYILSVVINVFFKLPVLRSANTFLGVVFGVIIAMTVLFVYSSFISSLVSSLGAVSPEWFGDDVVEKTLLVNFFSKHSLVSIVNSVLS